MKRPAVRLASAALLVIALALFGEGTWIYLKAELAQWLLHRAWTRTLAGEARVKPWPWADTWPVARLRLPEAGGDLIVLAGTTGRTLAFGPGHWSDTALPGDPGLCVLSGHRDTQFASLAKLVRGDRVLLETPTGHRHVYRVAELRILDRKDRGVLAEDSSEGSTLSLVTCYPFEAVVPGGPLRYVVTAREVNRGRRRADRP